MNNIINETWLSNQLAWLLDPKGSHNLGGDFAKKFFENSLNKVPLKKELNFDTFEVSREFYLQVEALDKTRNDESARRIDIVYMDLSQKTVFVIENKYEGNNSENQLSEYMQIENLFPNCDIYYMYLHFRGKDIELKNLNELYKVELLDKYEIASWKIEIKNVLEEISLKSYEIFKLYKIIQHETNRFEEDFTEDELKDISLVGLNMIDEIYLDKTSKWEFDKDKKHIKTNNKHQKITVSLKGKNIEFRYGEVGAKDKVVNIQNIFSNKQIILYILHVLVKASKFEKVGAYKDKKIDIIKDKLYNKLYKKFPTSIQNKIEGMEK